MIDWRTSRFIILFLTLMVVVVVILAVAEVRSSRFAPALANSNFSPFSLFTEAPSFSLSGLFGDSAEEIEERQPQVAGISGEFIGPRFPVTIKKGSAPNPFIPSP